jgi:hypothetical protein
MFSFGCLYGSRRDRRVRYVFSFWERVRRRAERECRRVEASVYVSSSSSSSSSSEVSHVGGSLEIFLRRVG